MSSLDVVHAQAMALSEEDRERLIELVAGSLSKDCEVEDAVLEECDRRMQASEENPERLATVADIMRILELE